MSRPLSLLALLAALTACDAAPPVPPATRSETPAPPSPPPADRPAPVASLAGEWRVAGIDGQALDQPVGLALSGSDTQIWWQPRCAGIARTYVIQGDRIEFGPTQPPPPAGTLPPPVCSIGLPPGLEEVVRALDDATAISRTENNGLLIRGPRHSVTLFSQ